MGYTFHLSFQVDDLSEAKQFYSRLGCRIGRERDGWFDIDFFGHQVTLHQGPLAETPSDRDASSRRNLDHFGVILSKEKWRSLLHALEDLGVEFRVPPRQSDAGGPKEKGKFMVVDPSGIGLEFKYYASMEESLERV